MLFVQVQEVKRTTMALITAATAAATTGAYVHLGLQRPSGIGCEPLACERAGRAATHKRPQSAAAAAAATSAKCVVQQQCADLWPCLVGHE